MVIRDNPLPFGHPPFQGGHGVAEGGRLKKCNPLKATWYQIYENKARLTKIHYKANEN